MLRDTAGQERFNNITESYYRTAKGVMFVYDITNGESFDNVAKWLRNLEQVIIDSIYLIKLRSYNFCHQNYQEYCRRNCQIYYWK